MGAFERLVTMVCGVPVGIMVAVWLLWDEVPHPELNRLSNTAIGVVVVSVLLSWIERFVKKASQ